MMTIKRIAVSILLLLCCAAALAADQPKLHTPANDASVGHYVITLAGSASSDDLSAMKREVAVLYGADIDEGPSAVRQFAANMTSARAKLLSSDPRVSEVAETPRTRPSAPPAASSSPAPRLTPRTSGYGDNGQSGTYTYDGSGNITAIGADTFLFDVENRLTQAVIRGVTETYTYDAFGNRKTATGATNCIGQTTCAQPVTVSNSTNRLLAINGATVHYETPGNITAIDAITGSPASVYDYDGTEMMTASTVGTDVRQYVYTADDERIAVKRGASWTWSVRDLNKKVLREFTSVETGSNFAMTSQAWLKDYIWRDGLLLATTTSNGTLHYHLDHLGTPRLITDANGVKVAEHAYYPFGAEINLTSHENPEEAMKFTGHERDIVAGDGHTLDYMHARYYNPTVGRFLSVDPVIGKPEQPQSWNRYAYVTNNPLRYRDPTGKNADVVCDTNHNCHVNVNAQIVADGRQQRRTANAFIAASQNYWNGRTVTTPNGQRLTFTMNYTVVSPQHRQANMDTLTVVTGVGRSHVDMSLMRGQNQRESPPDTGEIFTSDSTHNPSGMAGIAPHESGHLMGLPDLYPPQGVPAFIGGPTRDIMEMSQPTNNANVASFVLNPANGNTVVVNLPPLIWPLPW